MVRFASLLCSLVDAVPARASLEAEAPSVEEVEIPEEEMEAMVADEAGGEAGDEVVDGSNDTS